jgi:hypothetical protein
LAMRPLESENVAYDQPGLRIALDDSCERSHGVPMPE